MADFYQEDVFEEFLTKPIEEIEKQSRAKIKQYMKEASKDFEEVLGIYVGDKATVVASIIQARAQHITSLLLVKTIQESTCQICSELSDQKQAFEKIGDQIEEFEKNSSRYAS